MQMIHSEPAASAVVGSFAHVALLVVAKFSVVPMVAELPSVTPVSSTAVMSQAVRDDGCRSRHHGQRELPVDRMAPVDSGNGWP